MLKNVNFELLACKIPNQFFISIIRATLIELLLILTDFSTSYKDHLLVSLCFINSNRHSSVVTKSCL